MPCTPPPPPPRTHNTHTCEQTHTRAHPPTPTHTHARTPTHTHSATQPHPPTPTHAHPHTHTHAHPPTPTHTHSAVRRGTTEVHSAQAARTTHTCQHVWREGVHTQIIVQTHPPTPANTKSQFFITPLWHSTHANMWPRLYPHTHLAPISVANDNHLSRWSHMHPAITASNRTPQWCDHMLLWGWTGGADDTQLSTKNWNNVSCESFQLHRHFTSYRTKVDEE